MELVHLVFTTMYLLLVATNLDGETDWQVGDWAVFVEAGATDKWEKIDNTSALTGVGANNQVSLWGGTNTLEGTTALTFTGGDLYVTGDGNSNNWYSAYQDTITAFSDSGSSTITLTLTQRDGGTLTTSFSNPQGTVTGTGSVNVIPLWSGTGSLSTSYLQQSTSFANDIFMPQYIRHTGDTNTLIGFPAGDRVILHAGGNSNVELVSNGVTLRYNGSTKLQTSSTGVFVTGALGVTNIDMTGILDISSSYPRINLNDTTNEDDWSIINADGSFTIYNVDDAVDALRINGSNDITISNDLTVSGGDIILSNTGRIQGIDTVSASTDAANKAYVDSAVSGAGSGTFLPLAGGTMTGDLKLNDNVDLYLGTGDDLQIFHSGTAGVINNKTGGLFIKNTLTDGDITFEADNGAGSVTAYFRIDGGDEINYFFKDIKFLDDGKIKFGDASDLQIYHDGSNSYINEIGTGSLVLKTGALLVRNPSDASMLDAQSGGAINLYYNGGKKLETTNTGALIHGNLNLNDNGHLRFGASDDLDIYHDGSNSKITENGQGDLFIGSNFLGIQNSAHSTYMAKFDSNGKVELYNNNNLRFETSNAGVSVFGDIDLNSSAMIDWANGDARIIEGEVGGYSLSFEIYNGTALQRTLLLEKNMDATFTGNVETGASQNGTSFLKVANQNSGSAATARVVSQAESSQIDMIATSSNYAGVTGWSDAGILSTDSGASRGLILNAVSGEVQIQTAQTTALTISSGQNATFAGSVTINGGTTTFNPDADSSLRILNAGTNAVAVFAAVGDVLYLGGNNTTGMYLDQSANAVFSGTLYMPSYIYHSGDPGNDTYFGFNGNDNFSVVTAGGYGLVIDSNRNATFTGDIIFSNNNQALKVESSDNLLVQVKSGNTVMTFDSAIKTVANANFEFDAGLIDINGSTGSAGQLLSSTGTTVDWIDAPSGGGANGTTAEGTGSNANYFSKLATFTIPSSSSFADLRAAFTIIGEETSNSAYAEISVMMRKGSSSATSLDAINIAVLNNVTNGDIDSQISSDNFYLKYTSGATMAVDLYMKKNNTFGQFDIIETSSNFDDWVTTYYTNSAWISALPSTTYTIQTKVTSGTFVTGSPNMYHEYFSGGIPGFGPPPPVAPFPNWFPMAPNGPSNVVEKTSTQPNNFQNWQFQMPTDGILQQITITNITRSFTNYRFRIYDQGTAGTTYPGTEIFTGATFSASQNVMALVPVNEIMEGGRVYAMSLDLNSNASPNRFRVAMLFAN